MTLRPSIDSLQPIGNPDNYYNKEQVNNQIATRSDTSLSNLDSTGQMIVDTQNGTISNCILDIPQNIKLTLENNVLTLKSGSVITLTGSTYSTVTTTQDNTLSFGSVSYGKRLVVFPSNSGGLSGGSVNITGVSSGTTPPETGSVFFNTNDKLIYTHASGEWNVWNRSYPICIVDCDSEGNVTFAKDSNGNDMIFNGAGFIGHHAFVYPNVKGLKPNGLNDDGTLKSNSSISNSLFIKELSSSVTDYTLWGLNFLNGHRQYNEVDYASDVDLAQTFSFWYLRKENKTGYVSGGAFVYSSECLFITYSTSGTTVTDFAIRQPVRTATVEMMNEKQGVLTFDSTPTQDSTNPVTSDGVYTALSGKQADITSISGYDATKTQTLKNVNGTLTWVDD